MSKEHITAAHRRNLRWLEKALAGRTSVPRLVLLEDLGAQIPPGFAARSRQVHSDSQHALYQRKYRTTNKQGHPRGSREPVRVGQRRAAREILRPFTIAKLLTRETIDGMEIYSVTEKLTNRLGGLNGTR